MSRSSRPITWISSEDPPEAFPILDYALSEPEGLLAAGGDLSPPRLLYAYRNAIFPWYNEGQPVLWWSPDPRCVLRPGAFHLARRLRRSLKSSGFFISFNAQFDEVIEACSGARHGQSGTWITREMKSAYRSLHRQGWAHSVEVRKQGALVGGLYGLSIGRAFFGESMFSRENNASKAAMLALSAELLERQFMILDCQVVSPHLLSLGATHMPREAFASLLDRACSPEAPLKLGNDACRPIIDYLPAPAHMA